MAPPVVPALDPIVIDESPTISILDLAEGINQIRGGSRVTRARTRIISGFSKVRRLQNAEKRARLDLYRFRLFKRAPVV